MKLKEVIKLIDGVVFTPSIYDENIEIQFAFASDLMSDALMLLRKAPDSFTSNGMLMTGLVTKQCVRTAEMLDFKVVLITRDKQPNENVFESAVEENIIVIGSPKSMFSCCGILYSNGIKGASDAN